jgi:peptide/nickel transport system substrate-binding protein
VEKRIDRREFLIKTGATVAGLAAADVLLLNPASAFAAGPTAGGSLNIGIGQVFEDINVLTAFGYRWGQLMAFSLYDTLVKFDSKGNAIPLLATKWETPTSKVTIVTLRQGVKFHDGSPFRVEDAVWSLNRIMSTTKPVSNNFLPLPPDIWDKAEKIDDTRLRIITKKPTQMIGNWRFWFMMPENADERKPNLGVLPMGTGAFKFKDFVSGVRLDLERFPEYWNGDRPYLDSLTYTFFADAATQIASFLSGQVQYLHDLSVAELPQVQGKRNSKLIPSGIFFEWWQPQMYFGPLTDVNVRRALMWAFDRKQDNDIAWAGKALDTWNPFIKTPYYNGENPTSISYNPAKAQKLLKAAGQPKLDLNMLVLSEPGPWTREAQVLQQGFQNAGINATIQTVSSTEWFDQLYTKRTSQGIAVNAGTLPFPWALIANYMMQATLLAPKGKPSVDPPLQAAYETAFAPANPAQYTSALHTIQHLMLRDATVYHTMMATDQNVAPQNLDGVDSTLIGDQRFDGAYFA